MVLAAVQEG